MLKDSARLQRVGPYVWKMSGLLDKTLDGPDAEYAATVLLAFMIKMHDMDLEQTLNLVRKLSQQVIFPLPIAVDKHFRRDADA